MRNIAMLSNHLIMDRVVSVTENGREILLLQGDDHFLSHGPTKQLPDTEMECNRIIRSKMVTLAKKIGTLDKAIIFLHCDCAECGIKMAKELNFPSEKIVFVLCNCSKGLKKQLLEKYGYKGIFEPECGGSKFMEKIFTDFLKTGQMAFN